MTGRPWAFVALLTPALPLACSGILGIHDIEPPSDAGHKDVSAGDVREEAAHDGSPADATDAFPPETGADVTTDTAMVEASDGPPPGCSTDAGGAGIGILGCPCSPVGAL